MRRIVSILATLGLAAAVISAEEEPDLDDLKVRAKIEAKAHWFKNLERRLGPNGVVLSNFQGKPFTGWTKTVVNGGLILAHTKDGKPDGLMTMWHKNRVKQQEVTYKDGKAEGPYFYWANNEVLLEKGTYKDGKLEGVAKKWNAKGELVEIVTFKNGVKVK